MSDPVADQQLVERIQAGDTSACGQCIDQYGASIYRLALRLMKNEADAEDVVQETFLNAFKAIDSFEARAQLSTWLYRIAYNTAMMRLRKNEPSLVLLTEDELAPAAPKQLYDWCCLPEPEFRRDEVRQQLEQAINDLPVTLRTVFVLREMEGLSTLETADALELTEATVKKRLQRARLWLRERLSEFFVATEELFDE